MKQFLDASGLNTYHTSFKRNIDSSFGRVDASILDLEGKVNDLNIASANEIRALWSS